VGVANTISGHLPKTRASSSGLKAVGMLKTRLAFHSVLVELTHMLKSKTFVGFLILVSGLKIKPVAGMSFEAAEAWHKA